MVYLTIKPGIIHAVDVEPLLTKSGGIKIGDRYYYPPKWHLTIEDAQEYAAELVRLKIKALTQELNILNSTINNPLTIVAGPPKKDE